MGDYERTGREVLPVVDSAPPRAYNLRSCSPYGCAGDGNSCRPDGGSCPISIRLWLLYPTGIPAPALNAWFVSGLTISPASEKRPKDQGFTARVTRPVGGIDPRRFRLRVPGLPGTLRRAQPRG
jgi:hypothetical protein